MTFNVKGGKSPLSGIVGDFRALTTKQWIAIAAALVIALVLQMYVGAIGCFGFLIVAVVLYMIPHILGVSSAKVKAVLGAVFVIAALVLGTALTTSLVNGQDAGDIPDGDRIRDVVITENGDGTATVEFELNPNIENFHPFVRTSHVTGVYNVGTNLAVNGEDDLTIYLQSGDTLDVSGAVYTLTSTEILNPNGTHSDDPWYAVTATVDTSGGLDSITVGSSDDSGRFDVSLAVLLRTGDSDIMGVVLYGNLYNLAFSVVFFILILVFSTMMRSSAEKTRKKMEAEGRLYPKGYGTCKECGAVVLPGEVNCRKCGAYIDVPDELRPKKKDFFQCSECGAEVPSDATECPRCGARFDSTENEVVHQDGSVDVSTEDVVCPDCGSTVPANADWCPRCGRMLRKD